MQGLLEKSPTASLGSFLDESEIQKWFIGLNDPGIPHKCGTLDILLLSRSFSYELKVLEFPILLVFPSPAAKL